MANEHPELKTGTSGETQAGAGMRYGNSRAAVNLGRKLKTLFHSNCAFKFALLIYAATFFYEVFSPLGHTEWLIYLLPILLNFPLKPLQVFLLPAIGTVLMLITLFLSPPGIIFGAEVFNRTLGIIILWLSAAALRHSIKVGALLRAESDALRESQMLLQSTMDNFPMAITYKDRDGRFIDVNKNVEATLGMSKEHIIGLTGYDLLPKENADECRRQDIEVMETRRPKQREERTVLPLGTVYHTDTCFPLIDTENRIYGVGHILNDITDLKQAEEILKRDKETVERMAEKRSREFDESKRMATLGVVASNVSHELRNPLAAINMATANVKRKSKEKSIEKNLDTINKKVSDASRIIENLLFFSKGKIVEYEEVPVCSLTDDTYNILKKRDHHKKNLRFSKQCFFSEGDTVRIDPRLMGQVCQNLINNAIEAVPEEGGKIDVKIMPGRKNEIKCIISDNGPGIPDEELEKIFEPFYSKKAKGTGLGLSISRRIIQLHGGSLKAESSEGKGAIFIMTLPIKKMMI